MSDNFDNLEDALRDARDRRAPKDVVPKRGLDRETLLALNANAKRDVFLITPGEVRMDKDGFPNAVADQNVERIPLAASIVTSAQLRHADVDPSEVPDLIVIPSKETS